MTVNGGSLAVLSASGLKVIVWSPFAMLNVRDTYTLFVERLTAIVYGRSPTGTVAIAVSVAPSITLTVPLPAFAT